MGFFGCVVVVPSASKDMVSSVVADEAKTSSVPRTSPSSLMAFVSIIHAKSLPYLPPVLRPFGPLRSCSIIHPASCSVVPYVAAKLARTCGLTLATKTFSASFGIVVVPSRSPLVYPASR